MLVTLSHSQLESTWSKYTWNIFLRCIRVTLLSLLPVVPCERWENSGVPSSSVGFDPPLLCPELSWMPGHAKAVVTSRGRFLVREECWDVTSWQEGVEALVVSRALLGRSGDRAERSTWLCFQMTSRGNIIGKAF